MTINRRFGSWNKIGDSSKFGASSFDAALVYALEVDWDGDGVYSGASEARYMCGMTISRGRRNMLQRTGEGFEVISTGKAVFTLWNEDGRYDGWNASSPLYPNVTYGKDCRLRVRDAVTGAIEYVFSGTISDIVPLGYSDKPQVNIHVEDGMVQLRNVTANVAMQEDVSPDTAIGLVLDDIGWPTRWGRDLDEEAADVIRYFWADGDTLAGNECEAIANSFFGYFFIDAEGKARFKIRSAVSPSVADFDESFIYKDIHNPQPWVNQRNVMRIKTHPYDSTGTVDLYQYAGDPIQIAAYGTQTIFVEYTYNGQPVPALSIVTPVATTDYLANTGSLGGGSNLTGYVSIAVTNFGNTAKMVITNTSSFAVYMILLKLRGVAIYPSSVQDVTYPEDPSTVTQPKLFMMDLKWQQNVNQAADFCSVMGPFFEGLHPFPTIQIESNFAYQFGIDLFDVVTLTSDRLGVNGVAFRVGGIEHESLDEGCQRVRSTFYLEPYIGGGDYGAWPLVWGESEFGW